jgi:uncharacterized protein (TIGR03437 family)
VITREDSMRARKANLRYRLTVFIGLAGLLTMILTSYSPLSLATSEARKPSPPSDKVSAVATGQSKNSFPDRLMSAGANVQLTTGGGAIHSILELGQPVGPGPLISVNAASFADALAPDSIVAAFGLNLAATTQSAQSMPLPINLGGVSVRVTDSAGIARFAKLLFVSPTQINYIMPAGTSDGLATVDVIPEGGGAVVASGGAQVTTVAPGIFAVSGTGSPPTAAGQWMRYSGGVMVDSGTLETPIAFGDPGDKVYLVLYGTDIRDRSSLSAVSATVGGSSGVVEYAGPQGSFVGLDQINILIPRSLVGAGPINVVVNVDGVAANTVKVTAGK